MKVALVGTGYIAGRHAAALTGAGVEIVGHVGRSGVDEAAARWGGRAYRDTAGLLAEEEVDAAWICVPPAAHGEIERALVEAGVPFYVEKPIGTDVDGPRRIEAVVRESGLIVEAGYYWRGMEVIPELRRMLVETPPHLVRAAWHGLVPPVPWWRVEADSGGQVVEQATHLFDLARFLLGEAEVLHSVGRRSALVDHPGLDVATVSAATLAFESGVVGVFTATCVLHGTVDAGIEFHCEGRKLTLTNKALRWEDADGSHEVPVGRDPLVVADERFLSAVRERDPSRILCDYSDAVRTQELCCRVREMAG
ncbi:Gfo/Idh/MocA family protein [Saccharothrix texasensis]|uniref:Putative dehydrogenase n=1 Tax=Saccharothrix texasensis TaxID=103734 RepID=A0A3N1H0E3_9PSEU|nr:Gfo/Idh/MocA family oxidoreductase [Saccharothrix texasensis]ROP36010.1 putative dehydrogenase [Saccharothrix texasensis]